MYVWHYQWHFQKDALNCDINAYNLRFWGNDVVMMMMKMMKIHWVKDTTDNLRDEWVGSSFYTSYTYVSHPIIIIILNSIFSSALFTAIPFFNFPFFIKSYFRIFSRINSYYLCQKVQIDRSFLKWNISNMGIWNTICTIESGILLSLEMFSNSVLSTPPNYFVCKSLYT